MINLDYTYTGSKGERVHVSLYGATPEQAAVVTWLQAENTWKRENEWQARELERERAREQEAADRAVRAKRLRAEHGALLKTLPGAYFRRAALERHGPNSGDYRGVVCCRTCDDGSHYEPEKLEFPCAEYRFARDWGFGID